MNIFVTVLLVASSLAGLNFSQTPKFQAKDLRRLTGAQWTGALTYLDYSANKKVSIPSNLTVTQSAGDKMSWVFDYQYPDEPRANKKHPVSITEGGTVIDGEKVVERMTLDAAALRIVTEQAGSDDDKRALFRHTYLFAASSFSIKKEVRYEGTAEFFERNEYRWKR